MYALTGRTRIKLSKIEYVDNSTTVSSQDFLQLDDILLNTRNALDLVGKVSIWKEELLVAAFNSNILRIKFHDNILPDFINYLFNSYNILKQIRARAIGTTSVAAIYWRDCKDIKLRIPSTVEQRFIVETLATWDTAIEKIEQLIAAKERKLNALAQNLLSGKRRIKGFSDAWQNYRLSEVLTEHGTLSSGNEEVFSVSVHKGLINQIEHLGRVFAASDTAHYSLVKPGDVVYTKSPTGDFPYGIVKQSRGDVPVLVSPLYGVFTPRTRHLGTFLDFYFESPLRTRNYLHPIIQKGAKNTINITNTTFLSNSLYLPTCDKEIAAIAETLNTARQEVDLLKEQAEKYGKQKRGLMRKLLTGEWRVAKTENVQ